VRARGHQPTGHPPIEIHQPLPVYAVAPTALVGRRRIDETVANDDRPVLKSRSNPLLDELYARGGEEEELGKRVDMQRRIEQQRTDSFGELRPARLAEEHGGTPGSI